MSEAQFIEMLRQEGYPEPVEVLRESNGHLDDHTHPFEVKALVLEGAIDLIVNGNTKTYGPGDIFHLGLEEVHAETYGVQGVRYLAARKQ